MRSLEKSPDTQTIVHRHGDEGVGREGGGVYNGGEIVLGVCGATSVEATTVYPYYDRKGLVLIARWPYD